MNARLWWFISVGCAVGAASAAVLAAEPSVESHDTQDSRPSYVTSTVVKSWLEHGQSVTLLDVRAADEFVAGHIAHAINIPYDQVTSIVAQLPHDTPIVLYCIHSTHRAPEAAKTLRALGFTNAYVLDGGIAAWRANGLTILASDPKQSPAILPFTNRCAHKAKSPS